MEGKIFREDETTFYAKGFFYLLSIEKSVKCL